jgi:hypothetical protein
MRVRVVLTDGNNTEDLYWVRHNGHEVVSGTPDEPVHLTYPKDGRVHLTGFPGRESRLFGTGPPIPLSAVTGHLALMTLTIKPPFRLRIPFERGREDAIVLVDVRTLPHDRLLWISIGLVEPGAVDRIEYEHDVEIRQLVVARIVTPWVYVAVGGATMDHERRKG